MADKQLSEVLKSETRKLMRELSALRTEVGELRAEVQRQQEAKPEKMYRRKEAAQLLGVSIEHLKTLLSRGDISCIKADHSRRNSPVLIPESALEQYQTSIRLGYGK